MNIKYYHSRLDLQGGQLVVRRHRSAESTGSEANPQRPDWLARRLNLIDIH